MDCCSVKKALIFDFDGTICYTFGNYDLQKTVQFLHEKMKLFGVEFSQERDAFDVFEDIRNQLPADKWKDAFIFADEILTEAEMQAVTNCELVTGVREILEQLIKEGYLVGVATNNSSECVRKLLNMYWPDLRIPVVGRVPDKPELMKPSAWTLEECMAILKVTKEDAYFIGDTRRDYECSVKAGCKFLGMGSTERKRNRLLSECGEISIVTDFYSLRRYLARMEWTNEKAN